MTPTHRTFTVSGVVLALALGLPCGGSEAAAGAPTLTAAEQAFSRHDLRGAAELYEAVAAAPGRPEDRATAARRRAFLDWRYFGRPDEARARLLAAAGEGAEVSSLLAELAALETDRRAWAAAREVASRALLRADTAADRRAARLRWAGAVVEEAAAARRSGGSPADPVRLADAVAVLGGLVAEEPGVLEPSALLLRGALLAGDGAAALDGWRSYYRVGPDGDVYGLLAEAHGELTALLPGWDGAAGVEATVRLVRALAAGRRFEEAALVARLPELAEAVRPEVAPLVAYADFLRRLGERVDEHYRRLAVGEVAPPEVLRVILEEVLAAWDGLDMPGEAPPVGDPAGLDPQALGAALEAIGPRLEAVFSERHGAYANVGTTAGYLDLHMGHRVVDDRRRIEQYGAEAEVRFILLDAMVSNGFQSWAWAFESQHGGWAKPEAIYQVRPAGADAPVRAWRRLTDPDERRRWDEEITRDSAADDAIAARRPVAYLPGLAGRLHRDGLEAVVAGLRDRGLAGDDLRRAFLRRLEDATLEASIFAHEGRHVIDQRAGIDEAAELEYRAKLSEVAFSPLPFLTLSRSVLAPNLGDETPHGRADERLVRGLVEWMEGNAGEIEGLDRDRPLLPQLDRLRADQLREAVRSLDPLAGG